MKVTIFITLAAASLHLASSTAIFMPFGISNGDSKVDIIDEDIDAEDDRLWVWLKEDTISVEFPFFENKFNVIFISRWGGWISFNTTSHLQSDYLHTIFPFSSYIDIRNGGDIYFRETTDDTILQQFTKEVRDSNFTDSFFTTDWVYVVTWNEVGFYGASELDKEKRNTFQLVLGLDVASNHSFVIFNYDRLEWTASIRDNNTGLGGDHAVAGYYSGYTNDFVYFGLPGSRTSAVLQWNLMSNVNVPGKWIFKLSKTACGDDYVYVLGMCLRYAGVLRYHKARKYCKSQGATIFMPVTKVEWMNFVDSDFYADVSQGKPKFKFWLNCILINDIWYWLVPDVGRTDYVPVTWNNFPSPPPTGKTGLVGLAVGKTNPWSSSRRYKKKHTFCQKLPEDV